MSPPPTPRAARTLARDPRFAAAMIVLGVFLAAAILAPWLAPHDPNENLGRADASMVPPSARFLLGTDRESRDVLSRLLFGARVSLATAGAASVIAAMFGAVVGIAAGAVGGRFDRAVGRATDFFLSLPLLVLLLAAGALFPRSQWMIIILVAATGWMGTARLVRAEVAALRSREFVLAAVGLGLPAPTVWARHILPHVLGPAAVALTLDLGGVLTAEATFSFLGFGVPDPDPSWGKMVAEGITNMHDGWWITAFPAAAVALCVAAAGLAGDALREARAGRPA